jgi:hypothetical protein
MVLKLENFTNQDQKCLENYEMWCYRRIKKTSWTDVKKEPLCTVTEERNILYMIKEGRLTTLSHLG